MKTMNKTEATAIFIREAMCFGETDGIPVKKSHFYLRI